jgi:general secretion pathway protein M
VTGLSPGVRRLLALAILAGLAWVLAFGIVVPLVAAFGEAQDIELRLREAAARKEEADRRVATLTAELQRLKAQQATAVGFMQSTSESLAAADLQTRLRTAVEAAQGELRSTTPQAGRDEGNYRRISIRGQIAVSIAALQKVFYDFEAGTPYLFLDNVEIRAQPLPRMRGPLQAAPPPPEDPVLDVRFDLYGYMRRTG